MTILLVYGKVRFLPVISRKFPINFMRNYADLESEFRRLELSMPDTAPPHLMKGNIGVVISLRSEGHAIVSGETALTEEEKSARLMQIIARIRQEMKAV